jgi:hypothetical protein
MINSQFPMTNADPPSWAAGIWSLAVDHRTRIGDESTKSYE